MRQSPAGLHILVSGLYHEGFLSKNDYERWASFYAAKKLTDQIDPVKISPSELVAKQKLTEKSRQLRMVLGQWNLDHKAGWREVWLQEAEKFPDLPESQKIIEKYMAKKMRAN